MSLEVPVRGIKKQLVDIVAENARQGLEQHKIKQMALPGQSKRALAELQKVFDLPGVPERIEGYDISNIQGTAAVGSMVVFEEGRPKQANYRRFKIKSVPGANDYAMLGEVIKRRFKRSGAESPGNGWSAMPDLILVDGGKGQLNAVNEAMKKSGVSIPVSSLAKEHEEIYLPDRSLPLVLPRNSPGLQLLQRVRDEAHRFAITYHRNVHNRNSFTSALDHISGIGPKRKRALLKQFGSVRVIQEASVDDIAAMKGMNRGLAERVKNSI